MTTYGVSENAIFMPGIVEPQFSQWLAFSGTSVTLGGEQRYLDSHLSYQRACLHAISYLTKFGYSPEQAYLLLGAAPIEGRLSGVVDIPNSCSTVYLPTAIFDFDVRPSPGGPHRIDPGIGAPRSANKSGPKKAAR
jgi:formamidase